MRVLSDYRRRVVLRRREEKRSAGCVAQGNKLSHAGVSAEEKRNLHCRAEVSAELSRKGRESRDGGIGF